MEKLTKPSGHTLLQSKRLTTVNTTQTPMVMMVRSDIFCLNIMHATDIDVSANPAPFATQFFQDDDFGGGFDDDGGFDGEGRSMMPDEDAGEQDLLAATQGHTRRVRPEFVNYARRAKRVDVRKLKDNIWTGLSIVVPKEDKEDGDMVSTSSFLFFKNSMDAKVWFVSGR